MTATGLEPALLDASLVQRIRRTRFVAFDFDGVLTDNTVYVTEDGRESVRCYRGDGIGLVVHGRLPGSFGLDATIGTASSSRNVARVRRQATCRWTT